MSRRGRPVLGELGGPEPGKVAMLAALWKELHGQALPWEHLHVFFSRTRRRSAYFYIKLESETAFIDIRRKNREKHSTKYNGSWTLPSKAPGK